MAKNHGSQIKDDDTYEALRKEGASKEKAARIANAKAAHTLDHDSTHLEDRPRTSSTTRRKRSASSVDRR